MTDTKPTDNQKVDANRELLIRAEKAEAERDKCAMMNDDQSRRVYAAEERVKRMVELMKEPSEQGAQMTKADELWEKYGPPKDPNSELYAQGKIKFLAALTEYGELVKADAVKVCNTVESVKWNMHLSGKPTTLKCSDAIKDMKLP